MCGIVGVFGPRASTAAVEKSVQLLLDRGPDFQSTFRPNSLLALGAARLAMTDPLPRSNQPFEKNGNWIVFNGEIYNYKKLRNWLEKAFSIVFNTDSDTEVLLEVLNMFGSEGTRYLNGMYAFAYFNHENQSLILGRDRLGKKPLYYTSRDKSIFWASTIRSLREIAEMNSLSKIGVQTYLAFGYTIDPKTVYEEIEAVNPGYCYEYSQGMLQKMSRSSNYNNREEYFGGESNVRKAIEDSVFDRIEGHEKIAISLSGGLDSSIVARVAASSMKEVVAYSLRWSDSDKARYNTDFDRAKVIAKNLGIKFVEVDFSNESQNLESNIIKYVSLMDEPNSNPTGVSLVPLYQKIAQDGFRLILTGDGADEIFGGYPRYESPLLKNSLRILNDKQVNATYHWNPFLRKLILGITNSSSPSIWANFHWNFEPREIHKLLASQVKCNSISEEMFWQIRNQDFEDFELNSYSALETVMQRDSSIWLTNESNRKLDRVSMAFSIEARSPFQDERVIDSASEARRSAAFKVGDKTLLRQTFPELHSVGVRSDKAGFISPVGNWLRMNPKVIEIGLEALADSALFNNDQVMARKNDQYSGDYRRIMQLWSLVVFGYWSKHSWRQ